MDLDALPNAFSHGLAREHGLSERRLRGLLAEGSLERLGHGLYRKADAPPADLDRIEIALRTSDATLCLTTAFISPLPHRCHPIRDRCRLAAITAPAEGPHTSSLAPVQ